MTPAAVSGCARSRYRRTAPGNRGDRGRTRETPTFENTIAAHGARRPHARSRRAHVRRGARERHEPRVSGARARVAAEAGGRRRRHRVQSGACSSASRRCTSRCRDRISTPDQKRLVTRVYEHFVRRGAKLNAGGEAAAVRDQPGARGPVRRLPRQGAGRREHLDRARARTDLAGFPASVVAAAETAADERGLAGKWAIVNTRSSVDPFLTFSTAPRPAREGLEEVQEPRRQRRRQRHQGDHRGHRQAARRAREAARLREPRALAHGDTMAAIRRRRRALLLKVWPAVGRARQREVADMQAIADREQPGIDDRAVGLPLLRREGAQGEVRPRPGRAQAVLRARTTWWRRRCGRPSAATTSRSRRSPARFPCSTPTCASGKSPTRAPGGIARCSTSTTSRAHGKRSGAWASSYRTQHTMDGP